MFECSSQMIWYDPWHSSIVEIVTTDTGLQKRYEVLEYLSGSCSISRERVQTQYITYPCSSEVAV